MYCVVFRRLPSVLVLFCDVGLRVHVLCCVQTSAQCAGLALKHYMLKPIQRIPQYRLLLQGKCNRR